jgi:hypothetical protein
MKIRRFFLRFAVALFSLAAMQSFAENRYIRTTITYLLHRDNVTHITLKGVPLTNIQGAGLACSGGGLENPVILVSSPNYKTYRDALMMAYALKQEVNLIFESTQKCVNDTYPIAWAIDFVGQ